MDKAFGNTDIQMKTPQIKNKAIHLPMIKSGLNTPTAKEILENPLKNRSNSITMTI